MDCAQNTITIRRQVIRLQGYTEGGLLKKRIPHGRHQGRRENGTGKPLPCGGFIYAGRVRPRHRKDETGRRGPNGAVSSRPFPADRSDGLKGKKQKKAAKKPV